MRRKTLILWSTTLMIFSMSLYKGHKIYYKKYYRPDVTVVGFVDMTDGLGRQSAELIQALSQDFSVRFRPTREDNRFQDVSKMVLDVMKKRSSPLGKVVIYEDAFISKTSRIFFQKRFKNPDPHQIRFAYSVIESTEIPTEWTNNLNDFFDAVVVPDPFLIEVYQNSGVKIPVFCLPLGLDIQPFLNKPLKSFRSSPMVFANLSVCGLRKNQTGLVKAFHKAFGNSPNVHLLLNCKYSSKQELYDELVKTIEDCHTENITLTSNRYEREDYLKLFQTIDCYVSLSKSEGFSIQPREAMALGIPTIISDNTAQTTICKTGLVIPVSCSTKEPAYYEIWQESWGERFNVDEDSAIEAFLTMYENYDQYLSYGAKARDWASQYDYSNMGIYYKTLVRPKKIIFSTENKVENQVLYTDSESLISRYKNIYPKISVENERMRK